MHNGCDGLTELRRNDDEMTRAVGAPFCCDAGSLVKTIQIEANICALG